MRFTKIKWNGKQVTLAWKHRGSDTESTASEMTCSDFPRAEFAEALQEFAKHIASLISAPVEWIDRMTVTTLSISYKGEGEARGLVVSASLPLEDSNAPFVINTPHLKEPVADIGEEGSTLPSGMVALMDRMFGLAEQYRLGTREQLDAFEGTGS